MKLYLVYYINMNTFTLLNEERYMCISIPNWASNKMGLNINKYTVSHCPLNMW